MLVIVNYGLGNLGSLLNMCKHIGVSAMVADDPDTICRASHLILPGVGAFDTGMQHLHHTGLDNVLSQIVTVNKTPILGICLGMQLMTQKSEEGTSNGLGWIDAETLKFQATPSCKVPHMGWNRLTYLNESPLFSREESERYYFIHSYYVKCGNRKEVIANAVHSTTFDAAFAKDNIFGVQFHPEKSHRYGSQLLTSFANL